MDSRLVKNLSSFEQGGFLYKTRSYVKNDNQDEIIPLKKTEEVKIDKEDLPIKQNQEQFEEFHFENKSLQSESYKRVKVSETQEMPLIPEMAPRPIQKPLTRSGAQIVSKTGYSKDVKKQYLEEIAGKHARQYSIIDSTNLNVMKKYESAISKMSF